MFKSNKSAIIRKAKKQNNLSLEDANKSQAIK